MNRVPYHRKLCPTPTRPASVPRTEREKPAAERHLWEFAALRDIFCVFLAVLAILAVVALSGITLPLAVAFGLAYLCDPLLQLGARRFGFGRRTSAALIMVAVFAITAGLLAWLGPVLVEQIRTLVSRAPIYFTTVSERFGFATGDAMAQFNELTQTLREDPRRILGGLAATTGKALVVARRFVGTTAYWMFFCTIVPVFFFVFAWKMPQIFAHIGAFIPRSRRAKVASIARQMDHAVNGFFRGRFVVAFVIGILLSFGWMFADVPYWALLGMCTGVLNIVPYVSAVGLPVAILLKYLDVAAAGGGFDVMAVLVWPSAVYVAVQFIDNWFLTPWIQSTQLDMGVATVMVAVFVGGTVGGVFGLLLAIPILACAKIIYREVVHPRLARWAEQN